MSDGRLTDKDLQPRRRRKRVKKVKRIKKADPSGRLTDSEVRRAARIMRRRGPNG